MGDQTGRLGWRQAVRRSRLPNAVKVTLLAHSETSTTHYHDDAMNEHGLRRDRLAAMCGVDERTVQRHFGTAERQGWLKLHRRGRNTGLQQTFHYITPSSPCCCLDCDRPYPTREASREAKEP